MRKQSIPGRFSPPTRPGYGAKGVVHVVAARLGCKGVVVDTGRANSYPGSMNGFRKHYSHFVGGLFLAGKAGWVMKVFAS